jgi:hypothetical protein
MGKSKGKPEMSGAGNSHNPHQISEESARAILAFYTNNREVDSVTSKGATSSNAGKVPVLKSNDTTEIVIYIRLMKSYINNLLMRNPMGVNDNPRDYANRMRGQANMPASIPNILLQNWILDSLFPLIKDTEEYLAYVS